MTMTARVMEHASPDALVELLLPNLWAGIADEVGAPANICVDSCLTLKYAYGQFGIRSELALADLVVREANGNSVLHGTPEPSWNDDGTVFDGHCILLLPDSGRHVDATVEQFEKVREQGGGPLVGRSVASTEEFRPGQLLPPGTRLAVQRGEIMMLYTLSHLSVADVIDGQPWIIQNAHRHYRAGVNLASLMLQALRIPEVIGRARQAPYPRPRALLRAVGDAPQEVDDDRDLRFLLPTSDGQQHLRLDEIPLPATTPAAYPRPLPTEVTGTASP
ncbi:hypothetical protein [Streptomyces sp. V1I1]|uniref:hypothetical protein n=1 Tax=Streptomyces sp. V1I1 TaxID=3042272 RepID=UPI002787503A|nr:hypothetical protein [Streptomyces sp. V1I1]MDQ0945988.1 hypothetical protein [Streptomyces sp. V1I1]